MAQGGAKKWLTCGCLGCVGLILIVLMAAVVFVALARRSVDREQPSEQVRPSPFETTPAEAATPEAATRRGRVRLHGLGAEFRVKPAKAGEALHVEGTYDPKNYELTERFEQGPDGFTYDIGFSRKGGGAGLIALFRNIVRHGESPGVTLVVPAEIKLDLEAEITQGGVELDLGGLSIASADIEFTQGGVALEVDEPLREPMESLRLHGSMGGVEAKSLGNASPRRLELDVRMGGADLDLRGDWRVDSEITLRTAQGGAHVKLPQDVEIVGLDPGSLGLQREGEVRKRQTLTFSVSSSQGEVSFE